MASNDDDRKPGEPSHIHLGPSHEKKGFNWLPWLLLALGLLALLLLLTRSCDRNEAAVAPVVTNDTDTVVTNTTTTTTAAGTSDVNLPGGRVVAVTSGGINEQMAGFLAGTEATPRTLVFDRLNFDTGEAVLRQQDRGDLQQMAEILKAYPNTQIRVVGYTDSRGPEPMNRDLGLERAQAIKAGLVEQGVAAGRIETASGGETNPDASNASAAGQAINRRAEVVIVRR